jgi:hypothetical protein
MPRLTLDLDALSVESFSPCESARVAEAAATVNGCSVACPTRFC